jgi:hypothetical protein
MSSTVLPAIAVSILLILGILLLIQVWFYPERSQERIVKIYEQQPRGYLIRDINSRAAQNGCMLWWLRLTLTPIVLIGLKEFIEWLLSR